MSADHRKPVVAFIVLAFLAAVLVGIHRAEARSAQFFASVVGESGTVQGTFPDAREAARVDRHAAEAALQVGASRLAGSAETEPEQSDGPAADREVGRATRTLRGQGRAESRSDAARPDPSAAQRAERAHRRATRVLRRQPPVRKAKHLASDVADGARRSLRQVRGGQDRSRSEERKAPLGPVERTADKPVELLDRTLR